MCKTEYLLKNIIKASPLQNMVLRVKNLECKSGEQYNAFFGSVSPEKMKRQVLRETHAFYDANLQMNIRCFNASKRSLFFATDLPNKQHALTFRSFQDNVDIAGPVFDQPIVQVATTNRGGYALMQTSYNSYGRGIIQWWDLQDPTISTFCSEYWGFVNHLEIHNEFLFYANKHQINAISSHDPYEDIGSMQYVVSPEKFITDFCINRENNHLFMHLDKWIPISIEGRNEVIRIPEGSISQVDIETQKSIQEYALWSSASHFSSSGNLLVSERYEGFYIQDIREQKSNEIALGSKKGFSKQIEVINECVFDLEDDGVLKIWDLRMPIACHQPKFDFEVTQFAYVENLFLLSSKNNLHVYTWSEMSMKEKVTSFLRNKFFSKS